MQSGDWKGLIQAAIDGNVQVARYYLAQGVDPNPFHPEMMTNPLLEAVRMNHLEIIELLLAHGADPKRTSQLGESALLIAKNNKSKQALKLLKKR